MQIGITAFMKTFIIVIKQLLIKDENHSYANIGLEFAAKFVSSFDDEEMHPTLTHTFDWLLNVSIITYIILDL